MEYVVNVAFSIHTLVMNSRIKELLVDAANAHNCDYFYFIDEDLRNKKHTLCVMITHFNSNTEDAIYCGGFIKYIKTIPGVYIDNLYQNEPIFKMIYASRNYLKTMDNRAKQNYNDFQRHRNYSETEYTLLQSLNAVKYKKNTCKPESVISYNDYLNMLNTKI